jgi:hypothetical protein
MKNNNFERLSVKHPYADQYYSRPGICLSFYIAEKIHHVAASLADAVELYTGLAGPDALCWYGAPSGSWVKLTSRKINKEYSHPRR